MVDFNQCMLIALSHTLMIGYANMRIVRGTVGLYQRQNDCNGAVSTLVRFM